MKKKLSPKGVLILILSFGLIFFIVFGSGSIFSFYQNSSNLFDSLFDRAFDYKRFSDIQLENQRLSFEIQKISEDIPINQDLKKKEALVYSKYPFSGGDKITISVGNKDKVEENMPVLHKGFLLGKVVSTSNHQSEVQTIFDPSWKNSVGVGDYSDKAVFKGGSNPLVDLIPKDSSIEVGDEVFNLSPNYPIYQSIGTISELESNAGELWKTGSVEVPYNINEIKKVKVLVDFP